MSSQRLFNDYMRHTKRGLDAGSGAPGDGGAELAERHACDVRFTAIEDILR